MGEWVVVRWTGRECSDRVFRGQCCLSCQEDADAFRFHPMLLCKKSLSKIGAHLVALGS